MIAVHVDDPEYAHYRDVAELPPHRLKEIQRFFLDYKVLENKAVDVDQIRGRAEAEQVIRDAVRLYQDRIAPTIGSGEVRSCLTHRNPASFPSFSAVRSRLSLPSAPVTVHPLENPRFSLLRKNQGARLSLGFEQSSLRVSNHRSHTGALC